MNSRILSQNTRNMCDICTCDNGRDFFPLVKKRKKRKKENRKRRLSVEVNASNAKRSWRPRWRYHDLATIENGRKSRATVIRWYFPLPWYIRATLLLRTVKNIVKAALKYYTVSGRKNCLHRTDYNLPLATWLARDRQFVLLAWGKYERGDNEIRDRWNTSSSPPLKIIIVQIFNLKRCWNVWNDMARNLYDTFVSWKNGTRMAISLIYILIFGLCTDINHLLVIRRKWIDNLIRFSKIS